jgi:hypothetical protein
MRGTPFQIAGLSSWLLGSDLLSLLLSSLLPPTPPPFRVTSSYGFTRLEAHELDSMPLFGRKDTRDEAPSPADSGERLKDNKGDVAELELNPLFGGALT